MTDLQGRVLVDTDDPSLKDIERVRLFTGDQMTQLDLGGDATKEAYRG